MPDCGLLLRQQVISSWSQRITRWRRLVNGTMSCTRKTPALAYSPKSFNLHSNNTLALAS